MHWKIAEIMLCNIIATYVAIKVTYKSLGDQTEVRSHTSERNTRISKILVGFLLCSNGKHSVGSVINGSVNSVLPIVS